jgi:hypothetical protein
MKWSMSFANSAELIADAAFEVPAVLGDEWCVTGHTFAWVLGAATPVTQCHVAKHLRLQV